MTLSQVEISKWIEAHIAEDSTKLLFKYGNNPQLRYAIMQIECRHKAAKKIPDFIANPDFRFPTLLSAEQCTSQSLARFHTTLIPSHSRVLDLTCGLGIDTFSLARKAKCVTSCELDAEIARTAIENAIALGLDNVEIITGDSSLICESIEEKSYDVIFVDPDRRGSGGHRLYALNDCHPDITQIQPRLLRIADTLIIKASPMLDITNTVSKLSDVKEIIALGTESECKELIIICNKGFVGEPRLRAVSLVRNSEESSFNFLGSEEKACEGTYGSPIAGDILYEPYPATMKIAPFCLLCRNFGTSAISRDSHLYFKSGEVETGFPGRKYEIKQIHRFDKKGIKEIMLRNTGLDISTRNFPLSAPQLASRLKIKTGSNRDILFATTSERGEKLMILAHRI